MNNEEKILTILETLVVKVDGFDKKIDNLEKKVDNLEIKVDNLEIKVNNLEKKVDNLEIKVENLEKDIQTVKNTTIIIETEHGKKLDALFDGYSQIYDVTKGIRKDVVELRSSQEKQDLHIKWLDSLRKAE